MKGIFLFCIILLTTINLFADLPGNKPRENSLVRLRGVKNLPENWVLYYNFFAPEKGKSISKDTSIIIQGGNGRPIDLYIWAKNINNGIITPHLSYWGWGNSITINLLTIRNDSLIFNENKSEAQLNNPKNKAMILGFASADKMNNMDGSAGMLLGVALFSLGLLIWMYVDKKKKKIKFS